MSRARRVGSIVVAVLLLAVGFLPLFGGPGYEFSLACGVLLPSAAGIVTALEAGPVARLSPLASLVRGVATGVLLALVALATALVHGVRVGFCDLGGGVLGFALTALPGAMLGGAWGAFVAERARRRVRRRRLVAVVSVLAAPLLGIGVSVWRFYASPMIFAFDPFFGYFSGTLYDTVVEPGTPLLTYRLGTACTLLGAGMIASLLERQDDGRLAPAPRDPTWTARFTLGVAALAASLLVTAFGPALGHWQTPATIARELGGRRAGARCDVVYADGLRDDEVALLVKDCDEELGQVERTFDVRGPSRVTAFFFKDAGQKKRLMGAGDTYIAKPWREEVYLQFAPYPHPVLGHELAHVVAGSFGRGPFHIAGAAGGLWPNPGLIEGVAVAASPDQDELTDETWAHAMAKLGILPPLERIFGLGFLNEQAGKSYTVAGACIRWLIAREGVARVRAIYGGAPVDWAALDAPFRAWLETVPLPDAALAYAKARFDRPAIFGRKCPHVVDALVHEADDCREGSRYDRAIALYGEALARDPHDDRATFGQAVARLEDGDPVLGRADLERLAGDEKAPRTWRDRAEEALADRAWLDGDFDAAARRYDALAARTVDEDAARTLEVKAMGARDPAARVPLRSFLVGTSPSRGSEPLLAAALLGAWSAKTGDPLADYIVGKNLVNKQLYVEAEGYLERARAVGPPSTRIYREILRQEGVIACALGDSALGARVRAEATAPGDASPFANSGGGRLELLERMLDRCFVAR